MILFLGKLIFACVELSDFVSFYWMKQILPQIFQTSWLFVQIYSFWARMIRITWSIVPVPTERIPVSLQWVNIFDDGDLDSSTHVGDLKVVWLSAFSFRVWEQLVSWLCGLPFPPDGLLWPQALSLSSRDTLRVFVRNSNVVWSVVSNALICVANSTAMVQWLGDQGSSFHYFN